MNPRHGRILVALTATLTTTLTTGCATGDRPASSPAIPSSSSVPVSSGPSTAHALTGPAGAPSIPTGTAGKPRGQRFDPEKVDARIATTVAQAFAVTSYTLDPRLDVSPNDGPRRGLQWVTPSLRSSLSQPLPGSGGAPWKALVDADGYTTVAVSEEEPEGVDGATSTARQEYVTVTRWDARKKQLGQPKTFVVTYTLTRPKPGAAWSISAIQ